MTTSRYFLGTIALIGGVYYYDQNVLPLFPRNKRIAHDLEYVDKKQAQLSSKLSGKIEDGKKELQKEHCLKDLIKESNLYQKVATKTDEFAQDVKGYKNQVADAATPEQDKNAVTRVIHKYIDTVNAAGGAETTTTPYSTVSQREEVKQKGWFDWLTKKQAPAEREWNDAKAKAEKEKDAWFNWGSKKSDEAEAQLKQAQKDAESKKDEWFAWGSKKADQAERDLKKAERDAQGKTDEWINWGSKKSDEAANELNKKYEEGRAEANRQASNLQSSYEDTKKQLGSKYNEERDRAIKTYESAKTNLDNLTTQFLKSTEPDKQAKLQKAKEDFNSSLSHLKSYGDDVANDIQQRFLNATKK